MRKVKYGETRKATFVVKPSKYTVVKIRVETLDNVGNFLKTDLAKTMGYFYKATFVTDAVRRFLFKYGSFQTGKESSHSVNGY